jgi:hypothetical protein
MALRSVVAQVEMGDVQGWIASPVPVSQVVNVVVQAQNAQSSPHWYGIPLFLGAATQPGPNSPNGTLGFVNSARLTGVEIGSGPFGVTIWYND